MWPLCPCTVQRPYLSDLDSIKNNEFASLRVQLFNWPPDRNDSKVFLHPWRVCSFTEQRKCTCNCVIYFSRETLIHLQVTFRFLLHFPRDGSFKQKYAGTWQREQPIPISPLCFECNFFINNTIRFNEKRFEIYSPLFLTRWKIQTRHYFSFRVILFPKRYRAKNRVIRISAHRSDSNIVAQHRRTTNYPCYLSSSLQSTFLRNRIRDSSVEKR